MSRERVQVAIGAGLRPVGELIFETDGRRQASVFRYSRAWLDRPDAFALAPGLPLGDAPAYRSGARASRRDALPGPVSDAAPDSWGRGLLARARGRGLNELECLLAANDFTRQGALRFLDAEGRPLSTAHPPVPRRVDLPGLRRLSHAFETGETAIGPPSEIARELHGSAGSLGGARPKSDYDDNGVLCIAKYTSARDRAPVERAEAATLWLARAVGLRAATVRLELTDTTRPVAIVQRFDREGERRRHYVSAQTFLDRGDGDGAYYTDIADAIRAHCRDAPRQLRELHNRLLFSILVSNTDDHLKNHGFLYVGDGLWALSPAFDINPQPERHRHLETGISELSGNIASTQAAIEAAPFFGITEDDARATAIRMAEQIVDRWQGFCREAGMTEAECAAYGPAFDHEESRAALAMRSRRPPVRSNRK